jgi:hypothetical protein
VTGFFDIEFHTRASLHPDSEPSDLISEHHGVVRYERESDGKVFRIGRVHAYRIHAGLAANHGVSLFDVCDSHSGHLHRLQAELYEPDGYTFNQELIVRLDAFEGDCLVLDYVVLHPKWRGLRIGLLAGRKAADLLGSGCGLTVCEVAPLNPDVAADIGVPVSWLPRHESFQTQREATVSLRQYARLMGFRRVGKTWFYALPMNQVTPTAEELLEGRRPEGNE